MAKGEDSHSEMAFARQSDGINVIFDQRSPASSRSQSQSSSGSSHTSDHGHNRGRSSYRGRYRSSPSSSRSSSSSSRSSSHSRSRSHPRCHRRSSRCGCNNHRRYGLSRHRRSPPRRYRAHSRSFNHSSSLDGYSRRTHYRSRSRSPRHCSRPERTESKSRDKHSQSSVRRYSPQSRSTSSGHLSLDDKRELLEAAKANAMKILGVENLELPKSVKPILSEESEGSKQSSPEPETWVRHDPAKTLLQSVETEPDDISNLKMSPRRRLITFSINNSVAKPTVSAPSCAKVTPRVDNYESRKPYGHWVPVKSRKTSSARKHTLTKSH